MAWVSIDDQFHDHPKAEQVGPLGRDLYVAGLEYANRNLTDGFVPKATAGRLVSFFDIPGANITVNPYDIVQLLLDAGMWIAVDGGFQIHDYLEYQPSAEEVQRRREQKRERQQRWRDRQASTSKEEGASQDDDIDASVDALRDEPHDAQTQVPSPKSQEPKTSTPKRAEHMAAARRARDPDPLFDAVLDVCYGVPQEMLTDDERGRINKALPQLRKLEATPEQVEQRASEYQARSPGYDLPPQTLTKLWNSLAKPRAAPSRNGRTREPDYSGIEEFSRKMHELEQQRR